MPRPKTKKRALQAFACPYPQCKMTSTTQGGITNHIQRKHLVSKDLRPKTPEPSGLQQATSVASNSHTSLSDPPQTPVPHPPTSSPNSSTPSSSFHQSLPQTPAPQPSASSLLNPSTPTRPARRDQTPLGSPRRPYPGPRVNSVGIHFQKHSWIDGTVCYLRN